MFCYFVSEKVREIICFQGRTLVLMAFDVDSSEDFFMDCCNSNPKLINTPCINQNTPLHMTIAKNQFWRMIFLVDNGAKIDIRNQYGQTPILLAAVCDRWDMVKYLLSKGADASIEDYDSNTVLKYCQDQRLTDIIDLLEKRSGKSNKIGEIQKDEFAIVYSEELGAKIEDK